MRSLKRLLVSSSLILLAVPAFAEDSFESSASSAISAEKDALLETSVFDQEATLSDEELARHRAREKIEVEQVTINAQDQDGEVNDNVAIGNTNGDNVITGEAFSDSTGFLSTVQNTGNNVLIQNTTIINVSVDAVTE